jgi:hypothetical protein
VRHDEDAVAQAHQLSSSDEISRMPLPDAAIRSAME